MVGRPLISILMPTHTRVDVLGIAIESVLNQTLVDFELLLVGDGCAPGTEGVVDGFNDDRIRFFDLPKAPHFGYANRNVALREARGKLIGFAADDDILLPDHFELLARSLTSSAVIAHSQAIWVSTDGIAAPLMANLEMPDELDNFMERKNSIPASCFLYRADSLSLLDAWPEDLPNAADWRLWQRIIRENPKASIVHCRQPTLLHFTATWKKSRSSGMPQFATLLSIADSAAWWPAELRVRVPAGQVEQQAYSALLKANPLGWTNAIRRAARDLTARLAWDDLQTVRPNLKAATDQLAAMGTELESGRADLTTTRAELATARDEFTLASARAELLEKELVLAKEAIEISRAEKQELSDYLRASLTDNERLTGDNEKMRASVAWRVQQAIVRVLHRRSKLS